MEGALLMFGLVIVIAFVGGIYFTLQDRKAKRARPESETTTEGRINQVQRRFKKAHRKNDAPSLFFYLFHYIPSIAPGGNLHVQLYIPVAIQCVSLRGALLFADLGFLFQARII